MEEHAHIQIHDLGFGDGAELLFEQADKSLAVGGSMHHISLCFEVAGLRSAQKLENMQGSLRQPLSDSFIREAGYEIENTYYSEPLNCAGLSFESLLYKKPGRALSQEQLMLASTIRTCYTQKELSIKASVSYIPPLFFFFLCVFTIQFLVC